MFHILQWRHNGCDGVSNYQPHDCLLIRLFRRRLKTRVTFEMSKYPRRPWDRYTAPNSKCIGSEQTNKTNKKNPKTLFILVVNLVEKMVSLWNSPVIWKLAQYLSNIWKPNCQVCHLWLFCWYCSFAMCIPVRTNIHGSVAFPALLPIHIENPHHYWNVVYL